MLSVLKGFKDFVMRGNVIDLAVGIVIGAAFTAVITAFTNAFINPVIHRAGGGGEFGGKVKIGGGQVLDWGLFLNALITFAITACTDACAAPEINCIALVGALRDGKLTSC